YHDTSGASTLAAHEPSFQTLLQSQSSGLPGIAPQGLIGGIHQGASAVTAGAVQGQPARFEYRPDGAIVFTVGGHSLRTALRAAQARSISSLVEERNNALVSLTDHITRNGKRGFRPQIAKSYLDTEDGYWLLWADAIAERLFDRTDFGVGTFPNGLTIVDSQ